MISLGGMSKLSNTPELSRLSETEGQQGGLLHDVLVRVSELKTSDFSYTAIQIRLTLLFCLSTLILLTAIF